MEQDKHIDKLFQAPKKEFKTHLAIPYNSRIIFSGIYGIGKSYFLERFFSLDENKSEYEMIRVSPVHYSISSTEDIFKYIKYDLLTELIYKGINVNELDLQIPEYLILYLKKHWKDIGINSLKFIGKLTKTMTGNIDIIESIVDLFSKLPNLNKFISEKKGKYDEGEILSNFMKEIGNTPLYDDTIVTKIIQSKIRSLKGTSETKKETVLIIDDLDRIDPEHIFRILNIFGAHFEYGSNETFERPSKNRFEFDKVILVCDINNIRNIFHNRYGADVDFTGYIDKFYTHEVFNFDIRSLVASIIHSIAAKYNLGSEELTHQLSVKDTQLFHYLLKVLFRKNLINLRSFLKFYQNSNLIQIRPFNVGNTRINPLDHSILWQFILLKQIVGDRNSLRKAFEKFQVKDFIDENIDIEKVFRKLLFIGTIQDHQASIERRCHYELDNNITFSFDIKYSDLKNETVSNLRYQAEIDGKDNQDPIHEDITYSEHFMPLLNKVISQLVDANIL